MQIQDREFYNKMKDLLLRIPRSKVGSGGREIIMPFRYCNDKGTNMYVALPVDGNIMFYNCYRASCPAKGVVDHNKLIEWNLYGEMGDLESVSSYHARVSKSTKNRVNNKTKTYNVASIYTEVCELSDSKLRYINNRIGTSITYDDLYRLKIVLNLHDLLSSNRISSLTRHENIVNQLDHFFLGFINKDNSFINMRNLAPDKVHESINKKYINYNLFNGLTNIKRQYVIPTNIDITNPNRVKVHIAEGVFDILSIFLNLRNEEPQSIYTAILGASYINTIKDIIHSTMIPNIELHIYPDMDFIESKEYYYLKTFLNEIKMTYRMPIYIHINMYEGEKDFGVPIERINEHISIL